MESGRTSDPRKDGSGSEEINWKCHCSKDGLIGVESEPRWMCVVFL